MRSLNNARSCLLLLGLLLFLVSDTVAQTEASATTPVTAQNLDNLIQGRLYSPNYFPIKGSPFLTEDWSLEDFRLLGKAYIDQPVWYDIYLDDLILLNQQGPNLYFIRLNKEHIQHFSLGDRRFINLMHSNYRELDLKPGYYELAVEDRISLLVKRSLEVQEEDGTLISYFSRSDRWYLVKNGTAFRVRNKKTFLLAAGKENKPQISTFVRNKKIRYKKAGDAEWLQLITFLNTLQTDSL